MSRYLQIQYTHTESRIVVLKNLIPKKPEINANKVNRRQRDGRSDFIIINIREENSERKGLEKRQRRVAVGRFSAAVVSR